LETHIFLSKSIAWGFCCWLGRYGTLAAAENGRFDKFQIVKLSALNFPSVLSKKTAIVTLSEALLQKRAAKDGGILRDRISSGLGAGGGCQSPQFLAAAQSRSGVLECSVGDIIDCSQGRSHSAISLPATAASLWCLVDQQNIIAIIAASSASIGSKVMDQNSSRPCRWVNESFNMWGKADRIRN
jgi:hypothetical protein